MSENHQIIIFLVIIFTLILFLLGLFFFLLFQKFHKNMELKQQESMRNLVIGQDNERTRIARDLHDSLNPELSSILMVIDDIESSNESILSAKHKAKVLLNQSISHIRQISHDLMSISLAKYSLAAALEDYLEEKSNTMCEFTFECNCFNAVFNDDIKGHIFRVIQEFCQNTLKHSNASRVSVNLMLENGNLNLDYKDNGIGFDNKYIETNGIGLKNIQSRIKLIDGYLNLDGRQGFKAEIIIKNILHEPTI